MAFFNKLGEKISSGASAVSDSAKRASEINRLNAKINSDMVEINNRYTEIGRAVKLRLIGGISDPEVLRLAGEIDTLIAGLNQMKAQIDVLKGIKYCPGCGATLGYEVLFCPNCGTKQPAQNNTAPVAEPVIAESAPIPAPVSEPIIAEPAPIPAPVAEPVTAEPEPIPAPVAEPVTAEPEPIPAPVAEPVISEPASIPAPVAEPVIPEEIPAPTADILPEENAAKEIAISLPQDIPQPAIKPFEMPAAPVTKPISSQPAEVKGSEAPVKYIFCTQCGNKEEEGTNFCSQCGSRLD